MGKREEGKEKKDQAEAASGDIDERAFPPPLARALKRARLINGNRRSKRGDLGEGMDGLGEEKALVNWTEGSDMDEARDL